MFLQHLLDQLAASLRDQVVAVEEVQRLAVVPSKLLAGNPSHSEASAEGLEDDCVLEVPGRPLLGDAVLTPQSAPGTLILMVLSTGRLQQLLGASLAHLTSGVLAANTPWAQVRLGLRSVAETLLLHQRLRFVVHQRQIAFLSVVDQQIF